MKRRPARSNNKFSRFGLRAHSVYTTHSYRGGVRR